MLYAGWLRSAPAAALALVAPVLWVTCDLLLTGDPLHALTSTQATAERIERPRSLSAALELAPAFLETILGSAVLWTGLAGVVILLRQPTERRWIAASLLLAGLVAFAVIGLAGLSVLERCLALPAAALIVFAAGALTAAAPRTRARVTIAVVLGVWCVASLPSAVRELDRVVDTARQRAAAQRDLVSLLRRPAVAGLLASCPNVIAAERVAPTVVLLRDRRAEGLIALRPGPQLPDSVLVVARHPDVDRVFDTPPTRADHAGFRTVAQSRHWSVASSCVAAGPR